MESEKTQNSTNTCVDISFKNLKYTILTKDKRYKFCAPNIEKKILDDISGCCKGG